MYLQEEEEEEDRLKQVTALSFHISRRNINTI
jgi:hypothetical protein